MNRTDLYMKLKWFLLAVLSLFLLVAFISCADDIVGPRVEEESPDDPADEQEDPNDGGGIIISFYKDYLGDVVQSPSVV